MYLLVCNPGYQPHWVNLAHTYVVSRIPFSDLAPSVPKKYFNCPNSLICFFKFDISPQSSPINTVIYIHYKNCDLLILMFNKFSMVSITVSKTLGVCLRPYRAFLICRLFLLVFSYSEPNWSSTKTSYIDPMKKCIRNIRLLEIPCQVYSTRNKYSTLNSSLLRKQMFLGSLLQMFEWIPWQQVLLSISPL